MAADWLNKWATYCHAIDDLIDQAFTPELLLGVLAQAAELYTHNFYARHGFHLRPLILTITSAYADSVRWEKSKDRGEQTMSDVLRLSGVEMYVLVAGICGGWAHMRDISRIVRQETWKANHDAAGNPH